MLNKITQSLLNEEEFISLKISKKGNKIKLILSTDIGVTPDNASPEIAALRAAIAQPLVLLNSHDAIFDDLEEHIDNYSTLVCSAKKQLEVMAANINNAVSDNNVIKKNSKKVSKNSAKEKKKEKEKDIELSSQVGESIDDIFSDENTSCF